MYKFNSIFILTVFSLTSCLKKTECSGHVYSKYNVPVSSKSITLIKQVSDAAKEQSSSVVAITDNSGYFHFSFHTKINRTYYITAEDINTANPNLKPANINIIDIYLTK